MKLIIANLLLSIPKLIVDSVNIVELKNALKTAEKVVKYLQGRNKNLTQVAENLSKLAKKQEKTIAELQDEVRERRIK